jgi:hypothetical protein
MTHSRRAWTGIAAGLVATVGLAVWLIFGTGGQHAPPKVIRVAPPPLQATVPTPDPVTGARTKVPLSTAAPRGAGLGAPDHLAGRSWPTSVTLTWRPVARALGYEIYRDGREIGRTTGLSFEDTGLRPGVTHSWTVAAIDAANALGDPSLSFTGAAGG